MVMMPRKRIAILAGVLLLVMACVGVDVAVDNKDAVPSAGWARSFADLAYPESALAAGVQGAVVIRATLDDEGNVADVFALSGSRTLIPDCLANAKKWKFKPNPEKLAFIVYDFEIRRGECHDASRSLFQKLYANLATITACTAVK